MSHGLLPAIIRASLLEKRHENVQINLQDRNKVTDVKNKTKQIMVTRESGEWGAKAKLGDWY